MSEIAGAFILGLACGLVGYAWLSAPERRRDRERPAIADRLALDWLERETPWEVGP